jgi:hypothetical protein
VCCGVGWGGVVWGGVVWGCVWWCGVVWGRVVWVGVGLGGVGRGVVGWCGGGVVVEGGAGCGARCHSLPDAKAYRPPVRTSTSSHHIPHARPPRTQLSNVCDKAHGSISCLKGIAPPRPQTLPSINYKNISQ